MLRTDALRSYSLPILLLLVAAVPALQGDKDKKPTTPQGGMEMPAPPKPAPEHAKLKKMVGTWDATVTIAGMPPAPGTMTWQMFGDFWLMGDFRSDFAGQPFKGHDMTGYDPDKKVYVGAWVDTMSPELTRSEGTYDASGKVLTMHMDGKDPATGQRIKMKMTSEMKDDDTIVFTMFQLGEGGAADEHMRISYKRRK